MIQRVLEAVIQPAIRDWERVEEPYGLLPLPESSWLDPWTVTLSVLGVVALSLGIGSVRRARRLRTGSASASGPMPGSIPRAEGSSARPDRTPAERAWDEFRELVDGDRFVTRSSEESLDRAAVVLDLGEEHLQAYRSLAAVVDRTRFGPEEPGDDEVQQVLERLPSRRILERAISRRREVRT